MADQGGLTLCSLCSFCHESLCTWIKKTVNKFAISNHMALLSGMHALRNYLKLICEHEPDSLPNKCKFCLIVYPPSCTRFLHCET